MFHTVGRFGWLAAAVAVCVLNAGVSRAQDEDRAALVAAIDKAEALVARGQWEEAAAAYEEALELAPRVYGNEDTITAAILHDLANAYRAMGQYDKAESCHRRSLKIYEAKGPNSLDVALGLSDLAIVYQETGRYEEAESLDLRSLKIYEAKRGKDHPDVARILNNLANVYRVTARFDEAEPLLRRSLKIYEAKLPQGYLDVARSLINLADLYRDMGRDDEAEPLYRRSLEINEDKLPMDHPLVATALNNLANVYRATGRYDEAEPLYRRALKVREEWLGKEHHRTAQSLYDLGELYSMTGRYKEAEPLLRRSLEIRVRQLGPDNSVVAGSLMGLAALYRHMGRYEEAESLFRRSLKIKEDTLGPNHPEVAKTLNSLAVLYEDMGQYDKAEPLYRRSLKIQEDKLGQDHPDVAKSVFMLTSVSARQGHWPEAIEAADRQRRLVRRYVARVLPGLSEKDQLTFLENTDSPPFHAIESLALAHRDDADLATRSAGWVLNGKAVAHEALAQRALAAADANDPATAELGRRLLGVRRRLAALTLAAAVPGQEEQRRKQLDDLAAQEDDLSRQLGQAGGRSARAEPWVELADVRKALPADAVLIEISRFEVFNFEAKGKDKESLDYRYAAWVIPAEGDVHVIDLGEAAAIEDAVKAVRQALKDAQGSPKHPSTITQDGEPDAEKALLKPLQKLSTLVLGPLAKHIDSKKRWYVSPDADLWLAPWAALLLKDGRYAVEAHTLSCLVSGRDLVAPRSEAKPGRPRLMADPDYDLGMREARAAVADLTGRPEGSDPGPALRGLPAGLRLGRAPRLPGTAAEAKAIKPALEKYAGAEAWLYQQDKALEGVFKTFRGPRVLVLSTHGFFLQNQEAAASDKIGTEEKGPALDKEGKPLQNPLLRCGLLLAGCNNRDQAKEGDEDGVLTGLEIVGTDLRGTDLVVLSACETGLGDIHNGEGVAGLRQAFQLAGARAVAATLWQIPDRESAKLMADFFAHLADGKDKAEALREAQLTMIQSRRDKNAAAHPFFWAAFTVTGQ